MNIFNQNIIENKEEHKAKLGRPLKEEIKLARSINLKLTEDDYVLLKKKAEKLGMKLRNTHGKWLLKDVLNPALR